MRTDASQLNRTVGLGLLAAPTIDVKRLRASWSMRQAWRVTARYRIHCGKGRISVQTRKLGANGPPVSKVGFGCYELTGCLAQSRKRTRSQSCCTHSISVSLCSTQMG